MSYRALYLADTWHSVDGESRPNPPGIFDVSIVDLFATMLRIVGGFGVILIDVTAAKLLGLPTGKLPSGDGAKRHAVAAQLREGGFTVKEVHRWFHVKHDAYGSAFVALAEFLDPDHFPLLADDPRATTAALREWHELGGHPWTGGAGDAGNAILRTVRYRHRRHDATPEWWSWSGPAADVIESPYLPQQWHRADQTTDRAFGYDRVRAYLAAMTCTEVAAEKLTHTALTAFDKKQAGWWLCEFGPWELDALCPDPIGYAPDESAEDGRRVRWVTSPTLALLDQLRREDPDFYAYRVLDSWTAPATPIMKTYAEKLRTMWDGAARIESPVVRELVRDGVKGAYRMGHGYMRSRQSSVQRPDWAAAITAQSRSNLWRRVWELGKAGGTFLGTWPMWIDVDNVFYPTDIENESGWTVWPHERPDLDDVAKLGHWRTGGTREVSRETGLPVSRRKRRAA